MFNQIVNTFDDYINPIIVKELRQVVRGKFFWGILIIFLAFQCTVLSLSLASKATYSQSTGSETLSFLFGVLLLVCFGLIPINAGFRFAKERNIGGDELLYITTITPRTVILGKFLATMCFNCIIISAFAPFMSMTFFLSGVDLPIMFIALLLTVILCGGGVMLQICLGSLARENNSLFFFRGLGLFLQFMCFLGITGITSEIFRYGLGRSFGSANMWFGLGTFLAVIVCASYFLYLCAAAAISPTGTNRLYPVRRFLSRFWLAAFVFAIIWVMLLSDFAPLFIWSFISIVVFTVYYIIAVCERDYLTRRVARELPESFASRIRAFLLFSGAAGGILWAVLMQSLTFVAIFILVRFKVFGSVRNHSNDLEDFTLFFIGMMGYGLAYTLMSAWIRRTFLDAYVTIKNTWVVVLISVVVCSLVPVFFGTFLGINDYILTLGNPLSLTHYKTRELGTMIAILGGILALVFNLKWLQRQFSEVMKASIKMPINFKAK